METTLRKAHYVSLWTAKPIFSAVTLVDCIANPEALGAAGIMMTSLQSEDAVAAVRIAMGVGCERDGVTQRASADYLVDNTSERIVCFIASTAYRHHSWDGNRVLS